jgi:histidinol-phosphate/aromatic aminotransferase/cobyric acid decarboxylase-like protein
MTIPGEIKGYLYPILVLAGILIVISSFRIRHMVLDLHRSRRGLQQFFTCLGKERWGPPFRVNEWRRNAIRHLIAQRETLDNDLWQMKNRWNNLREMEREEQKKISELEIEEQKSSVTGDVEKSRFIRFEISRNMIKTGDLRNRILEKEVRIRSMENDLQRINKCLRSYMKGENPRLPVIRYIRGLFLDLR